MAGDPRSESAKWDTFQHEKTVLVVVRTLTSAIRLLEATPIFTGDPRVGVKYTVDTRSQFSTRSVELIERLPAEVIPWRRASRVDCDLVMAASEKIDLRPRRPAPMIVLPHGIGFHKHVPDVDGLGTRVSGLVAPEVLRRGQVSMLITHPDQERQLAELSSATRGRTVLGGDTSFDLLTASRPFREQFRDRLGLTKGQRLVLVTSTWREQSLLGTHPDLVDRLLGELPADEYRVAIVAHPNVWTRHSEAELRRVLGTALRAGALLIDPTRGWHAAMVAADLVVGDHGSLSLYAAAIGVPLLLTEFGDEVVAGTPMAQLGRTARRLDPTIPLRPQVESAIHDPGTAVADTLFALPGQAHRLLRTWCYQALELTEPTTEPPLDAAPDPTAALPPVHAFEVVGEVRQGPVVELQRYPAPVGSHRPHHLSVDVRERNLRLYADAAVIVRSAGTDVEAWLAATIERYPGLRMAGHATEYGCAVLVRDGRRFDLHTPESLRDTGLLTSALYTLLASGPIPDAFELLRGRVAVRPAPPRPRPR